MNSGQHFGQLLRTWRTDNQWTQQQVADAVGWDKPQVSRLESGKREALTVEEALALCALMGASIGEAVKAVAFPAPRALGPDWLGQRIARLTGQRHSDVHEVATALYRHSASVEHALRCNGADYPTSRSFVTLRGNHTRAITRELSGAFER